MQKREKVEHILEAWLQFIQLQDRNQAKVAGKDTKLSDFSISQVIALRQNKIYFDQPLFSRLKQSFNLDKIGNQAKPWVLSFPQIYTVKKGTSEFCPLFSLDISTILTGEYSEQGWDISRLPITEAGSNLVEFAAIEEEDLEQLITKEGLERFLKTTFSGTFHSFEGWMRQLSHKSYSIRAEPYLFRYQGSGFSVNLKPDLKNIQAVKDKKWIHKSHPAYQYLFNQNKQSIQLETCCLGGFPTKPPTDSQVIALKQSKTQALTAVQGPPGSGKTTLILHAIAQQVVKRAIQLIEGHKEDNNLTVISSTNNKAVDNVLERLSEVTQLNDDTEPYFLYLKGGSKKTIGSSDGAADQIQKALDYLENHHYHVKTYQRLVEETTALLSTIRTAEQHYQHIQQQRKKDEQSIPQLQQSIRAAQKKILQATETCAQLESRRNKINYFEALPKAAYEQVKQRFAIAKMQLPEKTPPRWIRWFYWLLGKSEQQIIAKAMTEPCQNAISETKNTPFALILPTDRKTLNKQLKIIEEGLARYEELQIIQADISYQKNEQERCVLLKSLTEDELEVIKARLSTELENFYQTFHIRYAEQNKQLFHLSRQILLQQALKRKEKLKATLIAYDKVITTTRDEREVNTQRMGEKLTEHITLLSLIFPVITSTLLSVRNMIPWVESCIDQVILDEAGMITLHQAFPLLVKTRSAIVVGDPLQIEPIIQLSAQSLGDYRQNFFLNKGFPEEDYWLYSPSEIKTATAYHRAASTDAEGHSNNEIQLKEHFRCQESIISYCCDIAKYNLVCLTKPTGSLLGSEMGEKDGPNMVAYHVEGKLTEQRNQDEVEAVCQIVQHLKDRGYATADIGITSPFRAQVEALRQTLTQRFPSIDANAIGTVHTFQGSEKPVMIFSSKVCPPSSNLSWINSRPNFLNVAVSRAKELFILVGNLPYLEGGRFTRKLVEHIEQNGVVLEYKTEAETTSKYQASSDIAIYSCDHLALFEKALSQVESELFLVVPIIRGEAAINFMHKIESVLRNKDIGVTIVYGTPSLEGDERNSTKEERALRALFAKYDKAKMVRVSGMGTNERLLICDEKFAIAGSWNWLSHRYGPACARRVLMAGVQIRNETSFRVTDISLIRSMKSKIKKMT